MRPYTRSLHPADYDFLMHAEPLRFFQAQMAKDGVPHREWHPHRFWEYASIMQQLEELSVPKDARIIDLGSGASFFPPYLAAVAGYPHVSVTDTMLYGDITAEVEAQRAHYGIMLPLYNVPIENMAMNGFGAEIGASDTWDVTMCISSIEHIDADQHDNGLREMCRITKPGGLIFITSDYFRDLAQWEASPSRHLQFTPYTKDLVLNIPNKIDADFVGETDLDYRGDFVHTYSFVNICLRKRAVSTSSGLLDDNGKAQRNV